MTVILIGGKRRIIKIETSFPIGERNRLVDLICHGTNNQSGRSSSAFAVRQLVCHHSTFTMAAITYRGLDVYRNNGFCAKTHIDDIQMLGSSH
jgi:hypothetical protein